MAVSIDTVYQKVLALANKEQRGYITPQEFNLFAHQAQGEIFEQYFYDINQWGKQHGNDTEYSDMLSVLQEKYSIFEERAIAQFVSSGVYDHRSNLKSLYRLGTIVARGNNAEIEQVNNNEWYHMQSAPLTRPTLARPVYVNRQDGLNIYPNTIQSIDVSYIRNPSQPKWGYVVIKNKALHDNETSEDFELHASEESELVYRILALAGISIEKPQLTQVAASLEQAKVQQEKQ